MRFLWYSAVGFPLIFLVFPFSRFCIQVFCVWFSSWRLVSRIRSLRNSEAEYTVFLFLCTSFYDSVLHLVFVSGHVVADDTLREEA